jgi:nucleoside-diphosphate-sugar epimerase
MRVMGRGMVARSLYPYIEAHPDAVAFAGGLANSLTIDDAPYERELGLLRATLDQCRADGHRLVYFSSAGAIYGATDNERSEDMPCFPVTRYGKHKQLCEETIRDSGARYLIIRLANLVGKDQNPTQLIPALVHQVKDGHVKIQQNATRDIMDVDDFADIVNRLLAVSTENKTIIIAAGQSVPVRDLVHAIQNALQCKATIEVSPNGESQRFSIDKLRALLPDLTFSSNYYQLVIEKYVICVSELS